MNRVSLEGAVIVLSLALLASTGWAATLDDIGKTYPVKERDALEEIEERVRAVDWGSFFSREKGKSMVRKYRPDGLPALPRALEDKVYYPDLTYTLEFDIPDGKGGILYPRGYRFNPLEYIRLHETLVFIDAGDQAQVRWFEQSGLADNFRVKLLLTGGSYLDAMEKLDRPVYYANQKIVKRLHIGGVPSVARQKGATMEVRQIAVKENTD